MDNNNYLSIEVIKDYTKPNHDAFNINWNTSNPSKKEFEIIRYIIDNCKIRHNE